MAGSSSWPRGMKRESCLGAGSGSLGTRHDGRAQGVVGREDAVVQDGMGPGRRNECTQPSEKGVGGHLGVGGPEPIGLLEVHPDLRATRAPACSAAAASASPAWQSAGTPSRAAAGRSPAGLPSGPRSSAPTAAPARQAACARPAARRSRPCAGPCTRGRFPGSCRRTGREGCPRSGGTAPPRSRARSLRR